MYWEALHNIGPSWRFTKHIRIVKVLRSPAANITKSRNKHCASLSVSDPGLFCESQKGKLIIQSQTYLHLPIHKYL